MSATIATVQRPRHALLVCTLAALVSVAGCGYNIPLLARPEAAPTPRAAVPDKAGRSKPVSQAHAKQSKSKAQRERAEAAPRHDDSVRGRLDDAREHAALMPTEAYWPFRAGELCVKLDSLDSAQAALMQSLARDPGYAPALALVSRLDYDAARHDDAIALLESARMAAQRAGRELEPELLAGLALHYDAAGRAADAKEALAAIPENEHRAASAAAATIALRHADRAQGAELAERAANDEPNSAACQNNFGVAKLQAGDPKGARKAFLKAIELDPRRAGPYYNLALLEKYYALDDSAALAWFAKYRGLSNEDPDGLAQVLGQGETKDLAEGREP